MTFLTRSSRLALWVGIEPTVSRVGDQILDQLVLSGFHDRPDDIDRLATVGAQAVRFPLLWERTAPQDVRQADWSWADQRLEGLSERGLEPILGLVHHGSGPPHTHLLDPGFVTGLRDYARAVAERYPQVSAYTPVNEPLTTARFSALYGHWYPHAQDERSFWLALRHQLQGTVLAMQEIRQVNPQATLIQTEDLGRVFSTPPLSSQAEFENERRWLSFDLLLGRVTPGHPMWDYLLWCGASPAELDWFCEHPCPPDLLGLNTYVTSERFLHDRSSGGSQGYLDTEAVRVRAELPGTAAARLREAHARYGLPLAITEAHLDCTREEQLRWLLETWRGAEAVREEGADVRAVTAWAAFGAFEWNSLLTRRDGHYESGLWDVRAPQPRATALARLASQLAAGQTPEHPVLAGPGWWRRAGRRLSPVHGVGDRELVCEGVCGPPLLITGATGTLGQAFRHACEERGLPYVLCTRQMLDIADPASVQAALERWQPWAVVNAAGYVRVDDAESDPRNERENVLGPQVLAEACAARATGLVNFSSDLVFDGRQRRPYVESDPPAPLGAYGRSKAAAEQAVRAAYPAALTIRTSAFFGPWDEHNFAAHVRRELRAGRRVRVAADQVVSPTYVPDLTRATLDLLIDGESGVWHLSNVGSLSWAQWACEVAALEGLNPDHIEAVASEALGQRATRPRYSVLASERGWIMPELSDALRHWSAVTARDMSAR